MNPQMVSPMVSQMIPPMYSRLVSQKESHLDTQMENIHYPDSANGCANESENLGTTKTEELVSQSLDDLRIKTLKLKAG